MIGTENMGDGWVKLLWLGGPDAYTMFRDHEMVKVAR